MFYHLKGELATLDGTLAVLDCQGVGYLLTVSMLTAEQLSGKFGEEIKLFTHMAVREDAVDLFGFLSREEIDMFRLLIGVSGVGPKAAMGVLSLFSPDRLVMAICSEDTKSISRSPGVGAKTAARIILELKDKLGKNTTFTEKTVGGAVSHVAPSTHGKLSEVTDALTVLGYTRQDILEAIKGIDMAKMSLEEIITSALKYFASKGR